MTLDRTLSGDESEENNNILKNNQELQQKLDEIQQQLADQRTAQKQLVDAQNAQ